MGCRATPPWLLVITLTVYLGENSQEPRLSEGADPLAPKNLKRAYPTSLLGPLATQGILGLPRWNSEPPGATSGPCTTRTTRRTTRTAPRKPEQPKTIMASPGQPPSNFERAKDKWQALEAAELQP